MVVPLLAVGCMSRQSSLWLWKGGRGWWLAWCCWPGAALVSVAPRHPSLSRELACGRTTKTGTVTLGTSLQALIPKFLAQHHLFFRLTQNIGMCDPCLVCRPALAPYPLPHAKINVLLPFHFLVHAPTSIITSSSFPTTIPTRQTQNRRHRPIANEQKEQPRGRHPCRRRDDGRSSSRFEEQCRGLANG